MNRRTLLRWAVNVTGLAVASVIAVPALVSVLSPLRRPGRRGRAWYRLGGIDQFPPGEVVKSIVASRGAVGVARTPSEAVYVWRVAAGEVVVFSPACTDLGCPVRYDPGSEFFYCPCHGGVFTKAGEPVAGPPARRLYRYANRLREGALEIDLASVPPVA